MKTSILAPALALLAAAVPASAQLAGPHAASGCTDIAHGAVTATGRLTRHVYPGPPNYQDVRRGDAAEPAYILALPRDICIDDGGVQADPNERFRVVQVYANSAALRRALRAAVGRRVRIDGEGFAAHTGHHRAPLVIEARGLDVLAPRRH